MLFFQAELGCSATSFPGTLGTTQGTVSTLLTLRISVAHPKHVFECFQWKFTRGLLYR